MPFPIILWDEEAIRAFTTCLAFFIMSLPFLTLARWLAGKKSVVCKIPATAIIVCAAIAFTLPIGTVTESTCQSMLDAGYRFEATITRYVIPIVFFVGTAAFYAAAVFVRKRI